MANTPHRSVPPGRWRIVAEFADGGRRYLVLGDDGNEALTGREKQILARASEGHSSKVIAFQLGLSASTVRVLLSRACRKLGAKTRKDAIRAFRAKPTGA